MVPMRPMNLHKLKVHDAQDACQSEPSAGS